MGITMLCSAKKLLEAGKFNSCLAEGFCCGIWAMVVVLRSTWVNAVELFKINLNHGIHILEQDRGMSLVKLEHASFSSIFLLTKFLDGGWTCCLDREMICTDPHVKILLQFSQLKLILMQPWIKILGVLVEAVLPFAIYRFTLVAECIS